ncbi:sarcosine oxidase subunit gamma [Sulfitobacter sp. F26169L]|uniref:sarcosine oxidase subunit gamma n=1 Tax=Sulfitobacter sp. F26169L TaxID=2996015 RepID=UPI002260AAA6|nr:sarcosine oxidase subunit gamma [Sulfitobacter sp. F26169L]MCX7565079.1 sarcosine oxidase subunit gamma [Sulfitobacter sp. F26169L]
MHDLKTVTALGGNTPRVDAFAHVTISENDGVALASVAARMGHEKKCHQVLKKLLGAVPEVGKAVLHDPEAGFWTGPDQWMLGAPRDTHELLADQLKSLLGDAASVTEQSGAWVCFDITGPAMPDLCERVCAVPIRRMQAGCVQRTVIHQLGCFVIRCVADDHVRILGPRASAASLHHTLLDAACSVA